MECVLGQGSAHQVIAQVLAQKRSLVKHKLVHQHVHRGLNGPHAMHIADQEHKNVLGYVGIKRKQPRKAALPKNVLTGLIGQVGHNAQ